MSVLIDFNNFGFAVTDTATANLEIAVYISMYVRCLGPKIFIYLLT